SVSEIEAIRLGRVLAEQLDRAIDVAGGVRDVRVERAARTAIQERAGLLGVARGDLFDQRAERIEIAPRRLGGTLGDERERRVDAVELADRTRDRAEHRDALRPADLV